MALRETTISVLLLLSSLSLAIPAGAADRIGSVKVVVVWAYGTPVDGPREDLKRNSAIYSGHLIETVRTGEVRMEFVDGTTLAMGSESALVLDELVFDPAGDAMRIALVSGFFHFVTGSVDKEAVAITTPAMVIGVRGTDIGIRVDVDGNTEVSVRDGIATATPTAGGETVEIGAGETGTASPGDRTVDVSRGLSGDAAGNMPASGSGFGDRGTASPQGSPEVDEAEIEREASEVEQDPDSASVN